MAINVESGAKDYYTRLVNDTMHISNGGIAENTYVSSGGTMHISNGGVAKYASAGWFGEIIVSDGGLATSAVLDDGDMYVSSGGTAVYTAVNRYGSMTVLNGGVAENTVLSSGTMFLSSGAVADNTVVKTAGQIYVDRDCIANSVTVSAGGLLSINSGGTATEVVWTPCVGNVSVYQGAVITYASQYSGVYFGSSNQLISSALAMNNKIVSGQMFVMNSGTANSVTVKPMGRMFIFSGGTAAYITVQTSGSLIVSSGGTATDVIWTPCEGNLTVQDGAVVSYASQYSGVYFGRNNQLISSALTMDNTLISGLATSMYVMSGGTANHTDIRQGYVYVWNGGTINNAHVDSGFVTISSGGVANFTAVGQLGCLRVSNGGVANSTAVTLGNLIVHSGGIANYASARVNGHIYISNGGCGNNVVVNSSGCVYVYSGGTATNLDWTPCVGRLEVESGAVVTYVSKYSGVYFGSRGQLLSAAQEMNSKIVTDAMYVMSGGVAASTTVSKYYNNGYYEYGYLYVSQGGVATLTAVMDGGTMSLYDGGNANSTTVADGGSVFVFSGGILSSATISSGGKLRVSSGGTAYRAFIKPGGKGAVFSGGVLSRATISSGGNLGVANGGTAFQTNIYSGGTVCISSGGTVINAAVGGYGELYISSGGIASNTAISSNCRVYLSSGGILKGSLQGEYGAYISAGSGAVIDFTLVGRTAEDDYLIEYLSAIMGTPTYTITVSADQTDGTYKLAQRATNFGGVITIGDGVAEYGDIKVNGAEFLHNDVIYKLIQSGSILLLDIVKKQPAVFIYSSGALTSSGFQINNAVIEYRGNDSMHISSGGIVNNTSIGPRGKVFISSGGRADSSVLYSGEITVYDGGLAESTVLNGNGSMFVSRGGTAVNTNIINGYMYIEEGGTASGAVVSSGEMCLSGGTGSGVTVNSQGSINITSGGIIRDVSIVSCGKMTVADGGTAGDVFVSAAAVSISAGGVANSTNVNSSGWMCISSGGVANSTNVNSGGYMYINSGGTATNVIWTPCVGYVYAADGAYVTYVSKYSGVYFGSNNQLLSHTQTMTGKIVNRSMYVMDGGVANSTNVNSGGSMFIYSGGVANSTNVNSWGSMFIYSGGVANSTIVNSRGSMRIDFGGVANSTNVNAGGRMDIEDGGVANSTTVNSSGWMYIEDGGVANSTTVSSGGSMRILSGGIHRGGLQIAAGAVVSAYSGSVIDFTLTGRTASDGYLINDLSLISGTPTYTITVSADQAAGEYKLAQGAANFTGTIAIGDETTQYGSITVNGDALEYKSVKYTLIQNSGNLTLNIFHIDTTPPEKPVAAADITAPTNGKVTVTASFSSDSVICQFSRNNITWQTYEGGIVFDDNGAVYFRSQDAAGNWSQVEAYEVSNIDKIAPTLEVSGNPADWTNSDVVLTAIASDGTVEYFDGTNWVIGNKITATENGTYKFRATDAAGNVAEHSVVVDKIDKVAPTLEVSGNPTAWTNSDVVLTAIASDGTVEYFDGTNWVTGNKITATENGTYKFRATDAAGNVAEHSVVVDKIDKVVTPDNLIGSADILQWQGTVYAEKYQIGLTESNSSGMLILEMPDTQLDLYAAGARTLNWQVAADNDQWVSGDPLVLANAGPQKFIADENGKSDLFMASGRGIWAKDYAASHQGCKGDWSGTGELVMLSGKNKLEDIFIGSTDANILVLTDDANGDALFVDDVYSAFPDELAAQARIAAIDEIRAGAGDDIVDMTSQRFEYVGDGVTVYGGLGNDVIWANSGENQLFGDAGNDRIVGGSDNDIIVGGAGNDSIHGGGGADTFCFGSAWGIDTVEQLAGGTITLWFESGSENFWNAGTMTYNDGVNSVTVKGVTADAVTLKFADVETAIAGAFENAASENVFEDQDKALIA